MILGIIVFILSSLGIYGFFTNNLYFLYIAFGAIILEYLIGYFSGQLKSPTPIWLTFIVAFGMICAGFNWLIAISICLCFENVITFVLGIIMMIIMYLHTQKFDYSNLETVLHDDILLTEVIYKRKTINPDLLLNKQNPYTGEIIQNYDDIIKYLKMYQLDCKNIDPLQILEEYK